MQQTTSKRKPRKLNRALDIQPASSRTSSLEGGVPLSEPDPQPPPDPTQPSRRRRPRKIAGNGPAHEQGNDRPDVTRDIRRLELRVQGIETQVQVIRRRGESAASAGRAGSKGARRRARRNRTAGGAATTDDDTGTESVAAASEGEADAGSAGDDATAPAENQASRVNENARRAAAVRTPDAAAADDVEYIPRPPPAPQPTPQRAIPVSGSYRIRLPASVSDRDLRAVQRGITGVQNIARRVLEDAADAPPTTASGNEAATRSDRGGWGGWLGAYSVSVARLVRGGDSSSGVEGPAVGPRPSVRWAGVQEREAAERRRPRKLRVGPGTGDGGGGLEGKNAESLLA